MPWPRDQQRVGLAFSGQGTQRRGMCRDFYTHEPAARSVFEAASDALSLDVAALCFTDDRRLTLTEFAQPALMTVQIAILRVVEQRGVGCPVLFGGHSLGEYSALVAAGVIPFAAAVKLVRARGRLMQEAMPPGRGAMLAVSGRTLRRAALDELLTGTAVDVACDNAVEQVLLAGPADDIATVDRRLMVEWPALERRRIDGSVPFHSRHLIGSAASFRTVLETASVDWQIDRADAVLSNLTGKRHRADRAGIVEALIGQMSQCVRWRENCLEFAAAQLPVIEIGAASVLRGFFVRLGVRAHAITTADQLDALFGRADVA